MAYMQFSKNDDLPRILPRIAEMYEEEFCVVPDGFDADFIETIVWHGYFPMAASFGRGNCIMLAKIHIQRCVLELGSLHIPKKVKQRASKYEVTIDSAWDQVSSISTRYRKSHPCIRFWLESTSTTRIVGCMTHWLQP
jgi:Leu/Phe-tRNA-protein transferase